MRSPDQTPEGWDSTSARYDEQMVQFLRPYALECIRFAEVQSDHTVIDVAAGSGYVALEVAPKVASVVATDFAPRMLEILRRRADELGIKNITTEVMDTENLTMADKTFDRALSNFSAMFYPDRVKGFAETCRVLKPGGRAVISAWGNPERFQAFPLFMASVQKAVPDLPRPPGPPLPFALSDPDTFRDEMKRGGFQDVRIESLALHFETPTPEDFWGRMEGAAPPVVAMLQRIGPENVAKARAHMTAALRERFGDGPVRLPCEAHFAIGIRG